MKYVETKKHNGMLVEKAVKKVLDDEPKSDKKSLVRKAIQDEVFDAEDSIADNAKMISLLLTMISRMYDALPATTKNNIVDKTTIDYVLTKFANVQTRADVQFAQEGSSLIDKLLDRQATIGHLVK